MDDLRIGVVGLGMGMSRSQLVVDTPGAELVAVADLRDDRCARAAEKFGCRTHASFDELLEHSDDLEVIYVMTESGKHADMGMAAAREKSPSLGTKHISPHGLRHTAAMDLLQHGVDRAVIALWLGHEPMESVQIYLHADLQMKEKALARTTPLNVRPGRYRPDDKILAFLKAL